MNFNALQKRLKKSILIPNDAMWNRIQRHNLTDENYSNARFKNHPTPLMRKNDLRSITCPEVITSRHQEYLTIDDDIIERNPFGNNRVSQHKYARKFHAYEMPCASSQIAWHCADKFTIQNTTKSRFVSDLMGSINDFVRSSSSLAQPDHSEKITLFKLLKKESKIHISFTKNAMKIPKDSSYALCFMRPQVQLFTVEKMGYDQIKNCVRRKEITENKLHKWIKEE